MIEPDVDHYDDLLHAMIDAWAAGHDEAFEQVIALLGRMKAIQDNQKRRMWMRIMSGGHR